MHPGTSIETACLKVGVSKNQYYKEAKAKSYSRAKMNAPAYAKVEAAPKATKPMMATDAGKLFLIVGTPEQIRGMLK